MTPEERAAADLCPDLKDAALETMRKAGAAGLTPGERAADIAEACVADGTIYVIDEALHVRALIASAIRDAVAEERALHKPVVDAATALVSGVYGTGEECVEERARQRVALVDALRDLNAATLRGPGALPRCGACDGPVVGPFPGKCANPERCVRAQDAKAAIRGRGKL